jgi:hypothetical protein
VAIRAHELVQGALALAPAKASVVSTHIDHILEKRFRGDAVELRALVLVQLLNALEKRDALGRAGIVESFGPLERAGALGRHVHGRGAAWRSVQQLRVDDENAGSNYFGVVVREGPEGGRQAGTTGHARASLSFVRIRQARASLSVGVGAPVESVSGAFLRSAAVSSTVTRVWPRRAVEFKPFESPRFNAASSTLQPTQHLATTHCMLMRARAFMHSRASWQRPESGTGPLRAELEHKKRRAWRTETNRAPSTSCR